MSVKNDVREDGDLALMAKLIGRIEVAMLTTHSPDTGLISRPLQTLQVDIQGDIWFFTSRSSRKAHDLKSDSTVNLSYAHPGEQLYLTVTGRATLLVDPRKIQELWSPVQTVFFPQGKTDPDLVCLRVEVTSAEYWEGATSPVARAFKFVKALIDKEPSDLGKNRTLDV